MQMYIRPFQIKGATQNAVMDGTNKQITVGQQGNRSVRLVNIGNQTVFFQLGLASEAATVAASVPLLANTAETFFLGNDVTTVNAIGTAGSTLYVTVGESA